MASEKLQDLCGKNRLEKWLFRVIYTTGGVAAQCDPTLGSAGKAMVAGVMGLGIVSTVLVRGESSSTEDRPCPLRQDTPVA